MPLDGPAQPNPKASVLAPRVKKYRRKPATPKQWAALHSEKNGPCRLCAKPGPSQLHHVIPRDRGGDDIAENLVPLCQPCHQKVELRAPAVCAALIESLWRDGPDPGPRGGPKDEYSYAVEKGGEDFAERIYGIRYETVAKPDRHGDSWEARQMARMGWEDEAT